MVKPKDGSTDRDSMLYFTIFAYLWKIGKTVKYEEIKNSIRDISKDFIGNGLINNEFIDSEIKHEINNLQELRVITESVGSTYYRLNDEFKDLLSENKNTRDYLLNKNNINKDILTIVKSHVDKPYMLASV